MSKKGSNFDPFFFTTNRPHRNSYNGDFSRNTRKLNSRNPVPTSCDQVQARASSAMLGEILIICRNFALCAKNAHITRFKRSAENQNLHDTDLTHPSSTCQYSGNRKSQMPNWITGRPHRDFDVVTEAI